MIIGLCLPALDQEQAPGWVTPLEGGFLGYLWTSRGSARYADGHLVDDRVGAGG